MVLPRKLRRGICHIEGGSGANRRSCRLAGQRYDKVCRWGVFRPLRNIVPDNDPRLFAFRPDVRTRNKVLGIIERPGPHYRNAGASRIGVPQACVAGATQMLFAARAAGSHVLVDRCYAARKGNLTFGYQRLLGECAAAPRLTNLAMAAIYRRKFGAIDPVSHRSAATATFDSHRPTPSANAAVPAVPRSGPR